MLKYPKPNDKVWWYKLRWQVIGDAGGICSLCYKEVATQVHHLVYPTGRREQARDLLAVCDGCHFNLHHPEAANDNFEQAEDQFKFG